MFRKLFSSWGSKNVPISDVGISDIAIFVGTCFVGTHTHTLIKAYCKLVRLCPSEKVHLIEIVLNALTFCHLHQIKILYGFRRDETHDTQNKFSFCALQKKVSHTVLERHEGE